MNLVPSMTMNFYEFDDKLRSLSPNLRQRATQAEQEDGDAEDLGNDTVLSSKADKELWDIISSNRAGRHFDVSKVKNTIATIARNVRKTIDAYMRDNDINSEERVSINAAAYQDSNLTELLRIVFGTGNIDDADWLENELKSTGHLQLIEVVTSLISAAVLRWILNPLPQGNKEHALTKATMAAFEDKSPALADCVRQEAMATYL